MLTLTEDRAPYSLTLTDKEDDGVTSWLDSGSATYGGSAGNSLIFVPAGDGGDTAGSGHGDHDHAGGEFPEERGPGGAGAPLRGGDLGAPLPVYTIDQIGDYIKEDFWDWFGPSNYRSYNMTAAGVGANSGVIYYDYDGYAGAIGGVSDANGLTAARRALTDDALDYIGELLGITFIHDSSPPSGGVDLYFMDADSGAYSNSTLYGSGNGAANHRYLDYSWVNINNTWSGGTSDINDYTYQTFIHEIGHALGLGHAGHYNFTLNWVTDTTDPNYLNNSNEYLNDSWQQAIMSYVDQDTNTYIPGATSYNYVISFMAGDWQALRDYYGSTSAFNGNTTYGFNTNILVGTSEVMANLSTYADETAFAIIDSDGTDTVDFSGYTTTQLINIAIASGSSTTGSISNIGGQIGNMTLGVGTVIENAIGGSGVDTILGNTVANVLTGNAGNDALFGDSGGDTLHGGSGDDLLEGGFDGDTVNGGSGDDTIYAMRASDIDGSVVGDTLNGDSNNDTIHGSGGADTINGGLDADTLNGRGGNDTIYANTSASIDGSVVGDTINGGDGNDTLFGSGGGDTINGGIGTDTIDGRAGNDVIHGDDGADTINGGAGNDQVFWEDGSVDSQDGGADVDTIMTTIAFGLGAYFDLGLGIYNNGGAFTETWSNFENYTGTGSGDEKIIGSSGANVITTGSGDNEILAAAGDDTINTGGGNDKVWWEGGTDFQDGGSGTDTIMTDQGFGPLAVFNLGAGTYTATSFVESWLNFENYDGTAGTGSETVIGSSGANVLSGGSGNNVLEGGSGVDTLNGNGGDDTLRGGFATDTVNGGAGDDLIIVLNGENIDVVDGGANTDTLDMSAVLATASTVDLGAGTHTGLGGTQATINVENFIGSQAADTITGSGSANVLDGEGGNDFISGGSGLDTLNGDAGDDILRGGFSVDTVNGGAGNDLIQIMNGEFIDDVDGGADIDTLDMSDEDGTAFGTAASINLATGVFNGYGGPQTVSNVENFTGTQLNDTIVGSAAANVLDGQGGNDNIAGGAGTDTLLGGLGDDTLSHGAGGPGESLNGGAGSDTGDWSFSVADAWDIDLGAGTAKIGATVYANLISIENATGGQLGDTITGNALSNVLDGQAGNDTIHGGGGNDTVNGGLGDDAINAGAGNDTVNAGDGDDTITDTEGMSAGDDDVHNGGAGIDTLVHDLNWVNTVAFNLTTGFSSYLGNRDQLISIENLTVGGEAAVTGSNVANVLTVNGTGANIIDGMDGDDIIFAGGGNDTVSGGNGTDIMRGEAGDDVLSQSFGGPGEIMDGGAGTDTGDWSYSTGSTWNISLVANTALIGATAYALLTSIENVVGGQLNDTITGDGNANVLDGQAGNDTIDGGAGNDTLIGGLGNDTLTGGMGDDNMTGGLGDDIYNVDSAGDVLTENVGEGTDKVNSTITYTLGANVENLTLTGAANNNGTGNGLDNVIVGNSGNNVLTGLAGNDVLTGQGGNDTMIGGLGDDIFNLDVATDMVTELVGEGTDKVNSAVTYTLGANVENLTLTGAANNNGIGNALNNVIVGNTGNNFLTGAGGDDTMAGGLGDDQYSVDAAGDVVTEGVGGGTDRVFSTVSFTMIGYVENLTLLGAAAIDGTGNVLDNIILGNSGNNVLSGGVGIDVLNGQGGDDTMSGGTGDDQFYVDSAGDVVIENVGEGLADKIYSTVTYTLSANVENMTLLGALSIDATGNALNNILVGNSGNNVFDGGLGNDSMQGGAGDDTYYREAVLDSVTEGVGGGTDLVYSSVTYAMNLNVENLILTGAAVQGLGNDLNNSITGNAVNNYLQGGLGTDTLIGGLGNDDYGVDATGDVVTEAVGEGTDRVFTSASYTLGANVENLTLLGAAAIDGTGNGEANMIIGNTANNVLTGLAGDDLLIGGGGEDTMAGGLGNDTYNVDSAGDVVTENAGEGVDRVKTTISYTLTAEVENLTITVGGTVSGTGNGLDNQLIGGAGANVLNGLAGNDLMNGLGGDDTLVWDAADTNVQGGADTDRLRIDGSGVALDLTLIADNVYRDIEIVDLTGTGNNGTTLALADVLAISFTTDTLRVDGNLGDTLTATDSASWATGLDQVIDGVTYHTYTQAAATLLVDVDVLSNL